MRVKRSVFDLEWRSSEVSPSAIVRASCGFDHTNLGTQRRAWWTSGDCDPECLRSSQGHKRHNIHSDGTKMKQQPPPDFFLSSLDSVALWSEVRACWVERRLRGPYHDHYALVTITPPIPASENCSADLNKHAILAPHSSGSTIFPMSELPLRVYVYVIRNLAILVGDAFDAADVAMQHGVKFILTGRWRKRLHRQLG